VVTFANRDRLLVGRVQTPGVNTHEDGVGDEKTGTSTVGTNTQDRVCIAAVPTPA
jgi:hypothetical protein